ncbi:putative tRNA-dihydrouridine synthase [Salinivirga cyanobacteriivorans]|uniref:tRNA-dihydrouridine synthase n=1 Tax=Salinivirga cyanobacteriivorans TaxID=1307839 RepID=A0A0S2I0P0_9BACT|nr:putative tRNA-dihydrouridine synthase [Salinivirga cyanobacteriivorans]
MIKIGNTELRDYPVVFAPMEDVSDPPFRYMCKQFGADLMYTEFIAAEGLVRDAKKSLKKLDIFDYERPIAIQIFGHNIDSMVGAAKMVAEVKPDIIDLNFGCPVKKVAGKGAGAGMLREPEKMVEMTAAIVKAVDIPVTVKTRLGWDEDSKIITELAEPLQDAGIAALTIHGRTRAQFYRGEADWTLIREVKQNPRINIPIIGNGDIKDPVGAKRMFDEYGVDAIMIGRAVIGRPWIFKEVRHYLDKGEFMPPLTIDDRVDMAQMHLQKSIEWKGDVYGVLEMRQHLSNYFKGLPNFKPRRLKLLTTPEPDGVRAQLEDIRKVYKNYALDNNHLIENHCSKLEKL